MRKTYRSSLFYSYAFFAVVLPFLLLASTSLGAEDGAEKWSFKTGSDVISSPAISQDGTIVVGSADSKIYAIHPDGTLRWTFNGPTLGVVSSPAIGADGTVYVGSYDYHLYAVNENGTQQWAYDTGGEVNSSPAIAPDGTIYVGSGGAGSTFKLHAINPDGSGKWTFDCQVVWSSPAIGLDGTIYVGSIDGNLYAINPDGSLKWQFDAGDYIYASPAIGNDGTIYIGANNGRLYAVNPDSAQKWVFETGGGSFNSFFSATIGADGTVYAGSNFPNNKLYAINPDGTQKWTYDTGEVHLSTPAVSSDGTIYVGSKQKNLYAINPDGTTKWEFETLGFVNASPVIGTDGTVYVGSADTYLYAISDAAGGPAASPWPMFRNNALHTGCPNADADELFDYWELLYFSDLSQDGVGDFDNDGLRNLLEFQMGLNPADTDSDNDGMPDGWEVTHAFDPLDENDAAQDADGDGFSNLDEYIFGFDPHIKAPVARCTLDPASGIAPLNVTFQDTSTGEITEWNWNFGDGSDSNEQHPIHTYIQTGIFTVILNVVGPGGSNTFFATVESINTAPVADAGSDQTVDELSQVQLNGTNSQDANDNINDYQWVQLDGPSVVILDDDTSQAAFRTPDVGPGGAVLKFQLTVTDSDGLTDSDTCLVNVSWINLPPTANAGQNQTKNEGTLVTLNGSASYDPDDGIASLEWTQTNGPVVALSDISATSPTFIAPDVGPAGATLSFTLTVTDAHGLENEDACTVNVSWVNVAPSANAGPDQTVAEGTQVILNGFGSSDPDDGISTYKWTQISGPGVVLSDPTAVYPTFTAPDVGPGGDSLVFQLEVTDHSGLKSTDRCTINISWNNLPPVASAGPDQTVNENAQVVLNGSGSSDPDDGIAFYDWKQIAGISVSLSDSGSVSPTFTAPDVGPGGSALTFELTVTDTQGLKATDTCIVNVSWDNLPPEADAGSDQTVSEGIQVTLNGFGSSDPDDGIASYLWIQTSGTTVALSDPSAVYPTFIAPDVGPAGGLLTFQLTVTDNGGLKSTDSCHINVTWSNLPPVANAGADQTVAEGVQVGLDGSGSSDTDDGIGTYHWTQIDGTSVTLSDPSAANPTFTAPDVGPAGEALTFQLTVTDNGGLKSTDTCLVNISWDNLPPVAHAGADQTVAEGAQVSLDGSGSSDTDDGIGSYHWVQIAGTPVALSNAATTYPSFTAPDVGPDGEALEFQLTVTDNGGLKSTDTCIVNVSWNNLPPVADAGSDQTVAEGAQVGLDGSGSSDTDDGISAYQWIQTGGISVTLSDPSAANPTFTAPDVDANGEALTFQLTVTDNGGLKSTDECTVNISWDNEPPVANAGPDQTVLEGLQVILNGFESSDPDDGIGSYQWTQIAGIDVQLSDPSSVYPSFTAPDVGPAGAMLVFQLKTIDGGGLEATDTCVVNVEWVNLLPVADAGPDQTPPEGSQVVLNGSGSTDTDDGISSMQWTQTFGTPVLLSDPTAVSPSFTAPDIGPEEEEILRFQLTVTDRSGMKSTDTCIIDVAWVNLTPIADAGPDQTVGEGLAVALNGTNSYDPDNEPLTYHWSQANGPLVEISGIDGAQASITVPDVGSDGISLQFELKVADPQGLSAVDQVSVNITWSNEPPVAAAGPNLTVSPAELIVLDGSDSYDRDGIDTYSWKQISGPEAFLSDPNAVKPTVTLGDPNLLEGSVVFELTVTDTGGLTAQDTVIVNIASDNLPPVADAGLNRSVSPDEEVMLDGLNSRDPDGTIASYEWKQIIGPAMVLSQPDSARPIFVPSIENEGASLVFELTVTDQGGLRGNDTVIVNVIGTNAPPVAIAGELQNVMPDETVTLNGNASNDPDGSIVSYRWRRLSGPQVILSDPTAAGPTFSSPAELSGCASLEFELAVTDDNGLSDTDTTIVNICATSSPPVADAGSDLTVEEGDTVTLDASNSSSPDFLPLAFEWKQIAGPQVILSDAGSSQPTFLAPEVETNGAELIFQLKVKDNNQICSLSEISVIVLDNGLVDTPPDTISFTTYDNQRLFVKCNENASLVKLNPIDPQDILDLNNRPDNLIYGLMDIKIKVPKPGDTAVLTVYLEQPAVDGYLWFKWDDVNGWRESGSSAVFNDERDEITVTLTDGGTGDDDMTADGCIVDPAGLGTPGTGPGGSSGSSSGGGGGCFIGTIFF